MNMPVMRFLTNLNYSNIIFVASHNPLVLIVIIISILVAVTMTAISKFYQLYRSPIKPVLVWYPGAGGIGQLYVSYWSKRDLVHKHTILYYHQPCWGWDWG